MEPPSPPSSLDEAARTILESVPQHGDATRLRFEAIAASDEPLRCAAVDGGSTLVLDARSVGVYCVRTGWSLRGVDDRFTDRTTYRVARTVTRRTHADAWRSLVKTLAWGVDVPTPSFDASRIVPQLAEAERILSEYDASRRALQELAAGELLLLDGSLEDEERYEPLRTSLLARADERGVHVVGLSKDSSLSIGGVLPFTLELEERASKEGIEGPFWCDATDALGRSDGPYRILGLRLDTRSPVYRLDVRAEDPRPVVARIAQLCNDAAYPGYPYVLARIHHRVNYESGEALDLRRDLEDLVSRRRGHRLSLRLFGRGRDVLELAQ